MVMGRSKPSHEILVAPLYLRNFVGLEHRGGQPRPFFTTKPAGEGTGLGLSMTHDIIVKQHGGRIDVATKPDEFTEFIITLPRGSASISNTE
jgi:hypothetical protein